MRKMNTIKLICILLIVLLGQHALAQEPQRRGRNSWAEMRRLSAEDHKRMMGFLGIESLRPGRNGMDLKAANYANYDESKANPYPDLPDPLVLKNGRQVTTANGFPNTRIEPTAKKATRQSI
jgi:hypothetical protein